MTDHNVVLKLAEHLYQRLRELADASNRTVEMVLLESIDSLFHRTELEGDLESMLAGLIDYTDAQLWGVVQSRLTPDQSARLQALSERAKHDELPANDQHELETLLDLADRQMLMRSEALRLLKERGHHVEAYFKPAV